MVIYKCDICDYSTIRKNQYHRHLSTKKHNKKIFSSNNTYLNSNKKTEILKCPFCSQIFTENNIMAQHLHDFHIDDLSLLSKGTKKSLFVDNYHNELKQVTQSNTKYVCEFCNKNFKHSNSYYRHLKHY